jgi:hypothetical protein
MPQAVQKLHRINTTELSRRHGHVVLATREELRRMRRLAKAQMHLCCCASSGNAPDARVARVAQGMASGARRRDCWPELAVDASDENDRRNAAARCGAEIM